MFVNTEIRRKQLDNLEQFVGDARKKLNSVLDCFGWKENTIKKEEKFVTCDINKHHRVPVHSLEEHHIKCKQKSLNYSPDEIYLSEPTNDPKSSIKISNAEKVTILSKASSTIPNFKKSWNGIDEDPQTSNRLTSTFSADERLALYDYVRSVTSGPETPSEFNVFDDEKSDDKELTYEELLEQKRNSKRRRMKYKTVHTNKKNHTEVLRNVISNQMELYQNWVLEKKSAKSSIDSKDYESSDKESLKSRHKYNHYKQDVKEGNSKLSYYCGEKNRRDVLGERDSKCLNDNKRADDFDRKRRRSRERDRSSHRSSSNHKTHRKSSRDDKRYKHADYRERRYK